MRRTPARLAWTLVLVAILGAGASAIAIDAVETSAVPSGVTSAVVAAADIPPDDGQVESPRPAGTSVLSTRPPAPVLGILVAAAAAAAGFAVGGAPTGGALQLVAPRRRSSASRAPPA